jgi:hypothetical protein
MSFLIDHLNGYAQAPASLAEAENPAISQITWIEVLVGARDEAEEVTLRLQMIHLGEERRGRGPPG